MQLARYFWLRINKMLFNYNKTFKQVDYHWSSKNISICRRYLRERCSEEYIRPRPSSTSFTPSHSCLSPFTICLLLTPSVCVAITWIKKTFRIRCTCAEFLLSSMLLRPDPGHPGHQCERPPDGGHADGEGRQRQLGGGLQSPDHHTPPHGAWQRGELKAFCLHTAWWYA